MREMKNFLKIFCTVTLLLVFGNMSPIRAIPFSREKARTPQPVAGEGNRAISGRAGNSSSRGFGGLLPPRERSSHQLLSLEEAPTTSQGSSLTRRVNAPYFVDDVQFAETAIFWFGHVTPAENYVDVRVGHNDNHLYLRIAVFDRRLWYTKTSTDFTAWDAATLYLNLDGNTGHAPDANTYRFEAQLVWWEPRQEYQASYRGDGSDWMTATVPFTTTSGWRGNAPNDDEDDRGWALSYYIPFESLGLDSPPAQNTVWGMAVALHDRDDEAGPPIGDKVWPMGMEAQQPSTWGQLAFGMPTYSSPAAIQTETITLRHKLNGAIVTDTAVGGTIGNLCPGDPYYIWHEWGEANFAGAPDFNIQNQSDVGDWPCFAKYYVTFPLDALPPNQVVLSATLTLHHWGGSDPSQAEPSLLQVLTVAEEWDETTLTWNNAPLAQENVAAAWVDVDTASGWPGTPCTWDVSGAAAEAYATGDSLRLALYESDAAYNSGKYFVSSDTGDWNAEGRPTLRVSLGAPLAEVQKEAHPSLLSAGKMVTYTLNLWGNNQPLTLTDALPAQVSAPGPIQISEGGVDYVTETHYLRWNGSLDVGQLVSITFPVTVLVGGPLAISNTAVLTDGDGRVSTDTAWFIVDAWLLYLPAIMRGW